MSSKTFRISNKITPLYETNEEGITDAGAIVIDKLLMDLKKYNILEGLDTTDRVNFLNFSSPNYYIFIF